MIESNPCRLLRHPPAGGVWNMAVDEMLLAGARNQSAACLRLYGWNEPTLSLGYFQNYSDREQHAASRHCAAVRRLTGGGAILHDRELTYSIVLPGNHPLAARRDELYQVMHGCLIEALASFDETARLCDGDCPNFRGPPHDAPPAQHDRENGTVPFPAAPQQPFLCFQRRAKGDVLRGENKICGSAQCRRNEAVLQHGSLLWQVSPAAPELPGLADLAGRPIPQADLVDSWLAGLARRLDFAWQPDELQETEVRQAKNLAESRYAGDDWTIYRGRRTPVERNSFRFPDKDKATL